MDGDQSDSVWCSRFAGESELIFDVRSANTVWCHGYIFHRELSGVSSKMAVSRLTNEYEFHFEKAPMLDPRFLRSIREGPTRGLMIKKNLSLDPGEVQSEFKTAYYLPPFLYLSNNLPATIEEHV
ncbi:hypothetical protein KIN20_026511 [Parelaphostrongylus tenuis]|uniref:Uncharacterized protein n=1 Tax=Parelaphostrongylus tenuis TaxID=148309 RepID=A0AAD5QY46_PARTN|nr:hypothetical protein KIN20_026511 [Parelaphostrongylus tenuis]